MIQAQLPTAPAVRRALDEVYALPEFRPRTLPGPLQWLSDRWSGAKAWFAETLERFGVWEATAPLLFWLVIGGLVLAGLLILAHFARVGQGAWRARERRGRAAEAGAAASAPRGLAEWEAEARRAAAEGRLRDAALALYQVLLLRLDAGGAVRYDPSKTPGDYRLEAMRRPEAARLLDAFLRGFEPVAFGGRPIDGAAYDALRRIAAEGGTPG